MNDADGARRPGFRLWIWATVLTPTAVWGNIDVLLHSGDIWRASLVLGWCLGLVLAYRVVQRQSLSPRWFWLLAGTVGASLMLIPLWHHGHEWRSRTRQRLGWTVFAIILTEIVGYFLYAHLTFVQVLRMQQ